MNKKTETPLAIIEQGHKPLVTSTAPQLSADIMSVVQETGSGLENVRAKDVIIPRLTILQGLSPQVTVNMPEYEASLRVGFIFDVGLSQAFPEGIHILPLHYLTQWLEWAPRRTGKGLVAIHDTAPDATQFKLNEKNQMITSAGNTIQETGQLYCLNLDAGGRPSFIPFASSQLKKLRKLMTYATNGIVTVNGIEVTPPLFYRSYKLTSVPESNAEGSWMGWKITPDKRLDELPEFAARLSAVKKFRSALVSGEVRGDLEREEDAEGQRQSSHEPKAM